MKIKNRIVLIAVLIAKVSFSQSSLNTNCYEIAHLDFFGLEDLETEIRWPESETEGIKKLALKDQAKDSTNTTSFVIPFIVYQLKDLHPNCVEEVETSYINRLIDLYFVVRRLDQELLKNQSISKQIDIIRDDFYALLKDDSNLIKMTFTLDDGPFYGIEAEEKGELSESLDTPFGSLDISIVDGQSVLTAINKTGDPIWSKIITGLSGQAFRTIEHGEDLFKETSLATRIHLSAGGEGLTLYVKNDGRFMYYFHSW